MKHLSISKKLIVGFGLVLLLLLLTVVLSLTNIGKVGQQVELYGRYTVPNGNSVWSMRRDLVSEQRNILGAIVTAYAGSDTSAVQDALDTAEKDAQNIADTLNSYANNQRNHDRDADIQNVKALLDQTSDIRNKMKTLILNGSYSSLQQAMMIYNGSYLPAFDKAVEILVNFSTTADQRAVQQRSDAQKTQELALSLLISCGTIALALTIVVIILIRKSILTPVREIVRVYEGIAKGNMGTEVTYFSRDELGEMAKLINETNILQSTILGDIIEKFTRISEGDMCIDITRDYPGDFAVLKSTIQKMSQNLNHTLQIIDIAAEQVNVGASQVSNGAQALATGSAEQAASVEELSASIALIAEQAVQNSTNVETATLYVKQAAEEVEDGDAHMKQLSEAMIKIGTDSEKINNITKVVEDIAFQTNILALNAAIEAARAGSAGKGFAVVADEVRSLAAKSAEAANQTAELIQRSALTVAEGRKLTDRTAQILREVTEKTEKVDDIIQMINKASAEQTAAIEQIKQGITQVSAVVQTNAATAEENSATSEEMSAQAATLRDEVGKFKLKTGAEQRSAGNVSLLNNDLMQADTVQIGVDGFGKY